MQSTTYSAHALMPMDGTSRTKFFYLPRGRSMTDPGSTSRLIHGPIVVGLRRWADGGLDVTVLMDRETAAHGIGGPKDVIDL